MSEFVINFVSISYSLFPIAIIGIGWYTQFPLFYRLCLLQALICMLFYGIIAFDFHAYNHALLNVYVFLEYSILMYSAILYFVKVRIRQWILIGYLAFVVTFILDLFLQGMDRLANHSIAVGAVPSLAIFMTILYRSLYNDNERPTFWLALGVVLYFCGSAPFLSMLSTIQHNYPALSNIFQSYLLEPLGHLRYILAAVSFWQFLRMRTLNFRVRSE